MRIINVWFEASTMHDIAGIDKFVIMAKYRDRLISRVVEKIDYPDENLMRLGC